MTSSLEKLDGEFKGSYYPLSTMTPEQQDQLINDHFLFDKPVSPLLTSAGMARDWPEARGIWHNDSKNLLVWINEEDHVRIISMEMTGNMTAVFKRFCDGCNKIEEQIKTMGHDFMWNKRLGFILTCPSNLGTGLRAGVHVKLPLLGKSSQFAPLLEQMRLQKRGTGGVDTMDNSGIYDISNLDRLSKSEWELVQNVVDGVRMLVNLEKALEKREPVNNAIVKYAGSFASKMITDGAIKKVDSLFDYRQCAIANFPDLSKHNNWMARCLTREIYMKYFNVKTSSGFGIDDVIQTGVDNPGHPYIMTVGCIAGDEESYDTFADLFDPVIEGRFNGFKKTDLHQTGLNPELIVGGEGLDPHYVLSCRVRSGRSIKGLALPTWCTRAERKEVETIMTSSLEKLDGEFKGSYYPLSSMTAEQQDQLINDHFLFDKPVSPLLTSAGMARDWPEARGIWHNDAKNLLVWINEEDHVRIISMEMTGNMTAVFKRFCDACSEIEDQIKLMGHNFMWSKRLGFILTCPSNLGTGLRAGVHVKLPLLGKSSQFAPLLEQMRLQKRGTGGVDTMDNSGIYDISNLERLGKSEWELVQNVIDGVTMLVDLEKALESGEEINSAI